MPKVPVTPVAVAKFNPPEEPHVMIGGGKVHLKLLRKIGQVAATVGEVALEAAIDALMAGKGGAD